MLRVTYQFINDVLLDFLVWEFAKNASFMSCNVICYCLCNWKSFENVISSQNAD